MTRSKLSRILLLLWVCLLGPAPLALAKKEKEPPATEAPSASPSFIPSTEAPTIIWINVTESPTHAPTTDNPTMAPSASTIPETLSPTSSTTTRTTTLVTNTPTSSTSISTRMVDAVPLPPIGIDVMIGNDAEWSLEDSSSWQRLQDDLTAFMEEMLETNSGVDSFDYVVLDFDVIQSSFSSQRRRNLATGLSIRVEGTAYYGLKEDSSNAPPSTDSLAMSLWTYFAIWGMEDLEKYLQAVGISSARIATITIDGEVVKPSMEGSPGYSHPGATLEQEEQGSETKVVISSPAVIAGLAAGCTVVLLFMAFLVMRPRHPKDGHRSTPKTEVDESHSTAQVGVAPDSLPAGDDESVGDLSADLSIYTTDDTIVTTSAQRQSQYDTKRLDRIIGLGKKHAEEVAGLDI